MSKPNGGPAFPRPNSQFMTAEDVGALDGYEGMTLRDYFAAKAMAALIGYETGSISLQKIADASGVEATGVMAGIAYCFADAMLAERSKS